MMEVGPFRLVPSEREGGQPTLKEVDGAWNEYSNVLFLDQPPGTGYSYVNTDSYVHELDTAADYVVEFLRKFYLIFPEFENMDTYLAGESFAGQYIPYTANAILKTTEIQTPLKGLLIGNGWIDPYNQYPAYYDFAVQNGVLIEGSESDTKVKGLNRECQDSLNAAGKDKLGVHNGNCERILGTILDSTVQTVDGQKLCMNTYDIRLTDQHPACGMNWPPDLKEMYQYLPRAEVKNAFHASAKEGGWTECDGRVGANFYTATSKPAIHLFPELLEQIPILLFAGEQDLICNWLGIKRLADDLEYNGAQGFEAAEEQEWYVDGDLAGSWQTARNLTLVKVANASHMVPFDVPLVTHDMLLRFTNIDLIGAAGQAAKVPSRVGEETEAVISETHPNGTAIEDTDSILGGQLSDIEPTLLPGAANVRDAYYNAGSAAVIVLLVLAVAGIFFCLRARVRKDSAARNSLGYYEAGPSSGSSSRRRRSHKRGNSSVSSNKTRNSDPGQEPHELEELVKHEDYVDPENRHRDDYRSSSSRRRPQDDEVFSLGDSDEEGAGDIGRQADEK